MLSILEESSISLVRLFIMCAAKYWHFILFNNRVIYKYYAYEECSFY